MKGALPRAQSSGVQIIMTDFIETNTNDDGIDRRGFLKCMAPIREKYDRDWMVQFRPKRCPLHWVGQRGKYPGGRLGYSGPGTTRLARKGRETEGGGQHHFPHHQGYSVPVTNTGFNTQTAPGGGRRPSTQEDARTNQLELYRNEPYTGRSRFYTRIN
jgi:hypothetical protein